MAEKEVKSEKSKDDDKSTDDKKTNKQFSQSEHDKGIKEAVQKVTDEFDEKYKDFDTMKEQLETLTTEKAETEKAKLSDKERATLENTEMQNKLEKLSNDNAVFKEQILKNEVMRDPKFDALPRRYRNEVTGNTVEEVQLNADALLAEFKADAKGFGNPAPETPQPPTTAHESRTATEVMNDPKNVRERARAILKEKGIEFN